MQGPHSIAKLLIKYKADVNLCNKNKIDTSQQKIMDKLDVQYPWLNALIKLIESIAKSKSARQTPFLSMEDKRNRSVLDQLEEITKASSRLTGSYGIFDTILVLSLTPVVFAYDITISEGLKNRVLTLSKPYKPALIPQSFTRVLARTLTSIFTKLNCSDLLDYVGLNLVHTANSA